MSHFLSHPIRFFRIHDFLTSFGLGTFSHNTLWYLLMCFLLTHFDRRIFCLNILKILPLLLDQRVSVYIIILFYCLSLMSNLSVEFGTICTWPIYDMVIAFADVKILCGINFNKFIREIYLLHSISLHVLGFWYSVWMTACHGHLKKNCLLFSHLYFGTHKYFISNSFFCNRKYFVFPVSLVRITDEVEYPWCFSLKFMVLRHFTL